MIYIDNTNFETEVLQKPGKTVVDFYAVWCGPCKMLSPIFEELEKKYDGEIRFAKCDTDEAVNTAVRLGISAIPTVILFEDGVEKDRFVGYMPKDQVEAFLKR